MLSRRRVLVAGVGLGAGMVTAGCTQSDGGGKSRDAAWSSPAPGSSSGDLTPSNGSPDGADAITITPASGATDVSPKQVIEVTAVSGTLGSVSVTSNGKAVAGELDSDQRTWRSTAPLRYSRTYTVTANGTGASGSPVQATSSFTTLKPAAVAQITFQASAMAALKSGGTYGVGQPVIVYFGKAIKDKKAAEAAMEVVTEPAVEGRWHWMDDHAAHWRPEKYWTAGTKVTVNVKTYGVNLGKGVYGGLDASTHFTIGRSRIAIADSNTHLMKCYIDGKLVKTIPISLGKGGYTKGSSGETIDFWTRSGPHVLLSKEPTHRMTSASYGIKDKNDPNYYDETIKLCCRISYSGEFVHLADWNIPAHGHRNTSHGCVNVGPANARWFFDNFQVGDVVEVRNTPKQLPVWDGLGDWTIPWNKW